MIRPAISAACLLALTAGTSALAGPLNPPSGPITPSYKTLSEVEARTAISAANTPGDATSLYKITQPGSYYLTGNVAGVSGKSGIVVTASNVTIDLGGFTLAGVSGSFVAVSASGLSNVSISNGVVTGWAQSGIYMASSSGARLSDLSCSFNGLSGLLLGDNSRVDRCVVRSNGMTGVSVGGESLVTGCISSTNGGSGISMSVGCKAERCTVASNTGAGIDTSDDANIADCVAYSNFGDGLSVFWNCTVTGCKLQGNHGNGVSFGANCQVMNSAAVSNVGDGLYGRNDATRCRIQGNDCTGNGVGVKLDATANLVIGNTCGGNTSLNYQIVANNRVGAIVVMPLSPAISGSTGGISGSVDPVCNFAY